MSFAQPWVLFLALLPLAWAWREWAGCRRRLALVFKAATFVLILAALAEPRLELWERRAALVVLTDNSAGIPEDQRQLQRDLVGRLRASADDLLIRPIAFDGAVRRGLPGESSTAGGTNLELALRNALAALPPDRVPRIALASDGLENLGAVERALDQARAQGVPIDVLPLDGRAKPLMRLEAVSAPDHAYSGELFPIDFALESPSATSAAVRLSAEGKPIGSAQVDLRPGMNYLRVRARIDSEGAALVRGVFAAPEAGEISFASVVRLSKPRLLLLSSDSGGHLEGVLEASGFEVERRNSFSAATPVNRAAWRQAFDLIVADNQDYERWPDNLKSELESFVSSGGGFLVVAGDKSLYVEREELDPLNRMLPATLAPPRTPEATAVVLVLDKSSSMEGKKMSLARQSAMGVIDNLREVDRVGVLVFDNSFQWAVPVRNNDEPALTKRLIAGIIADGGTQIAPALHEAYRHILPQQAVYKHILLLTDGISEEGDSIQLAREAAEQKITISTIGLGQDVNRAYLDRVAKTAEGRSYLVLDIAQLAQVVLRDVLEHTGSSVTEREFAPRVVTQAEILEGIDLDAAGPLLGWVRFEAKRAAETILAVQDAEEEDPLLVRWQYGLGRSAVFSSDAKARWAANWVTWSGFDRFWANTLRDLLPRSPRVDAEAGFDRASSELVATYRLDGEPPSELPELLVLGPAGFRGAARLERTATGVYEARLAIGERFGLFRIRAAADQDRFPELALHRENEELLRWGSDPALLRRIADASGGRFDPTPQALLSTDGRAEPSVLDLWPFLLALAVLLNLAEILGRKGWLPWPGT